MRLVLAVFNIGIIIFLSYRLWARDQSSIRNLFWPALLLKCIAGVSIGIVYSYYYTVGDTFTYFRDGISLANLARSDFASYISFLWSGDESFSVWSELSYTQPRAMFLSKLTSVSCILSGDNYWIISIHFSFIAFLSTWVLTKKVIAFNQGAKTAVIIALWFFPSVVFWTSGVIKESLAMAGLYFLCFVFLKVWNSERLKIYEWILSLISLWWLWNLKYYYVAIFLPISVTALLVRFILNKFTVKRLIAKGFLWLVIFTLPLLLVSFLHPNFYPDRFMEVVVSSYYEFLALSEPEDVIHYDSLKASVLSILQNAPWALLSGLFRPTLFEVQTVFQFIAAVENLALLILTISAMTSIKNMITSRHRLILVSIIVYVSLLCIFLALSTPNFAT